MAGPDPLQGASPARIAMLGIRFLLELALLGCVAVLALSVTAAWWRWLLALSGVAAVAGIWGLFVSPKAKFRLPGAAVVAVEATLFVGVAAWLYLSGSVTPGIGLFVAWLLHRIALAAVH